jgi:hypothetical protein
MRTLCSGNSFHIGGRSFLMYGLFGGILRNRNRQYVLHKMRRGNVFRGRSQSLFALFVQLHVLHGGKQLFGL